MLLNSRIVNILRVFLFLFLHLLLILIYLCIFLLKVNLPYGSFMFALIYEHVSILAPRLLICVVNVSLVVAHSHGTPSEGVARQIAHIVLTHVPVVKFEPVRFQAFQPLV